MLERRFSHRPNHLLRTTLLLITVLYTTLNFQGLAFAQTSHSVTAIRGVSEGGTLRGNAYIEATTSGTVSDVIFEVRGPKSFRRTEKGAPWWLLGNNGTVVNPWNTKDYPDGSYTLTAIAVDTKGVQASRSVRFTISNSTSTSATPAPASSTLRITSINGVSDGSVLRGKPFIEAKTEGSVASVVFAVTGPKNFTHTERNAPYTLNDNSGNVWDTTQFPNGSYKLTVTATGTNGATTSTSRSFSINNSTGTTATPAPAPSTGTSGTFGRPTLNNPKTVYLSNSKPEYWGNGSEDIIVVVQEKLTRPASIKNVRNFVMIGGEFTISEPLPAKRLCDSRSCNDADAKRHRALIIWDVYGTAYLEGIYINGTNGNMTEGIQIGGTSGGKVIIVNSRIERLTMVAGDLDDALYSHPDLIQLMGGSLYLRNVTLTGSQFQGVFMQGENGETLGEVRAQRVNIRGVRRQAWFVSNNNVSRRIWVQSDDVWNSQDSASRRSEPQYPFIPAPDQITSSEVRWNNATRITPGLTIKRGVPSNGDFAPASKVGRSYDANFFK
jgi:hypothetical protein